MSALSPLKCVNTRGLERSAASTFLFVALVGTVSASAEPAHGFRLQWRAPAGCPTEEKVRDQLDALLGSEGASLLSVPLNMSGTVTVKESGVELSLEQVGQSSGGGRRLIAARTCEDLDRAAAVVIALVLRKRQDETTSGPPPSPPSAGIAQPSPMESVPSANRQPPPSPPDDSRSVPTNGPFALRLVPVRFDSKVLPKWSVGAGLGLSYRYRRSHFGLTVAVDLPQNHHSDAALDYTSRFHRESAELFVAHGFRSGTVEFAPYVIAGLERVTASATGDLIESQTRTAYATSIGPGVGGDWRPCRWVALSMTFYGRLLLQRPSFVVEGLLGTEVAYRLPRASWGANLAYEWIF